jgi:hypothetical protein
MSSRSEQASLAVSKLFSASKRETLSRRERRNGYLHVGQCSADHGDEVRGFTETREQIPDLRRHLFGRQAEPFHITNCNELFRSWRTDGGSRRLTFN